ncbi:MAG: hypothetical protein SVW57_06215 [Thermodesulfobacteriota bacterium]|nr:hypothetical protein [Thermodesulfobacteriota bacterium]
MNDKELIWFSEQITEVLEKIEKNKHLLSICELQEIDQLIKDLGEENNLINLGKAKRYQALEGLNK